MRLPLFPLQTVLFPGGVLPLRIFETRYLDMVRECLRTQTGFGIVRIRSGREVGAAAEIFSIGTAVEIVDWEQRTDGLLGILVEGRSRIQITTSSVGANELRLGEVDALSPEPETPVLLPNDALVKLLDRILSELDGQFVRLRRHRTTEAGWVGNRLAELLPLHGEVKQGLLELHDPMERVTILRELLEGLNERRPTPRGPSGTGAFDGSNE